tara:strand:- start:367 stop:468 length:102 start_codon:yes stop_codon:yes gene_type:complete
MHQALMGDFEKLFFIAFKDDKREYYSKQILLII